MFTSSLRICCSQEEWKSVAFGEKQRLFKIQSFLFMSKGRTYSIEIQESFDGDFLSHGENTADPHDVLKSFHGSSLQDCLQLMIEQIENKEEKGFETRAART